MRLASKMKKKLRNMIIFSIIWILLVCLFSDLLKWLISIPANLISSSILYSLTKGGRIAIDFLMSVLGGVILIVSWIFYGLSELFSKSKSNQSVEIKEPEFKSTFTTGYTSDTNAPIECTDYTIEDSEVE